MSHRRLMKVKGKSTRPVLRLKVDQLAKERPNSGEEKKGDSIRVRDQSRTMISSWNRGLIAEMRGRSPSRLKGEEKILGTKFKKEERHTHLSERGKHAGH